MNDEISQIETSNVISFPIEWKDIRVPAIDALNITSSIGPIEKQMREQLSKLRGCKYPDNFDWSLYDRISDSFEQPPRGGVVFNTILKLQNWHSACSKCHYALEIDTYGRGCFHNCEYCYAKDELSIHGYWNRPQPFPINLAEVRKIFYVVFETDRPSKWRDILGRRIPIRVGSMSDSFMWLDTKYGVTKELLKILKFYRYPYVIFTRSDLVAHSDYLELLDPTIGSIQFSISGNNHALIRRIEPGAPSYSRRLKALSILNKAGFRTAVRINPLFPRFPDGYYSDPAYLNKRFGSLDELPTLPFYNDEFIPEIAETKTPTVLAGFVRLSPRTVAGMSKAIGIDLKQFFRPELMKQRGDRFYSDAEIGYYYRLMQKDCAKSGLRFSTCYIGNGLKDYHAYQALWSNKNDCCDVRQGNDSVSPTCQEIPWEVRKQHAKSKDEAILVEQAERLHDSVLVDSIDRIKQSELNNSLD